MSDEIYFSYHYGQNGDIDVFSKAQSSVVHLVLSGVWVKQVNGQYLVTTLRNSF